MQDVFGNILVVGGMVLFAIQAAHALWALLGTPKLATVEADKSNAMEKIVAALVEKFPVGALGVASIWLGGQILGWF